MFKFLSRMTLNQRLALLALVLGAIALAATPTTAGRVTIDGREMARLMSDDVDRVDVRTLAGWIIESRADVRLVDLREPSAFASGPRIPSAENIPLSSLADAGLERTERILLVSDDEARAAQAWFLLRAEGYKGVAIVRGGLRAWQEDVVYPAIVDGLTAQERARLEAVSAHFGGAPRAAAGGSIAAAPATPAVVQAAPPVPPPAGTRKTAPAKKREGC